MLWPDYTNPESQTKKTKEQIAREKAGRLARVKGSSRLPRDKIGKQRPSPLGAQGDTQLKIVDLTDDEGAWKSTSVARERRGGLGCPPGGTLHLPRLGLVG